jgi:2-polyprenyl-6-methoxyphenol hydroxylase-like FAD-dependent oxidoreductase
MPRIVVIGAGVVALGAAMLLAGDGHEVIMLERDPDRPPGQLADAWDQWQRPGLNQFRLPHAFQGGFRSVLDTELPAASKALEAAGALRLNFIRDVLPATMTGGWRDGDESYEWLTARRPVMEAVLAAQAEAADGIEVRRGAGVTGLISGTPVIPGVPHVTGVQTRAGEVIPADLVVDMSGRGSALPGWLADIGAPRPVEEFEDCGFVYYGRHFKSADGSVPPLIGPPQISWGTITSLTLPCDNGTWSVGLVTSSKDTAMRPLREAGQWQAVARSLPLVAHWLDGSPADDGVRVTAHLEDRHRDFVVDGRAVVSRHPRHRPAPAGRDRGRRPGRHL